MMSMSLGVIILDWMEQTKMKEVINYAEEAKKLEERENLPDFWKPVPGQHHIIILSEMEPFTFTDKEGVEQKRAAILIEENNIKYKWTMGYGETRASSYGQLIDIATKNNNILFGKKVVVVVKSDGKKNDYTLLSL
jgi:hypothetical protein